MSQSNEGEEMLSTLGVIGLSAKENEQRLPLHPEHIHALDADLRARITLKHGYGVQFGVADASLREHISGFPRVNRSWRTPMCCCFPSRSMRTLRF